MHIMDLVCIKSNLPSAVAARNYQGYTSCVTKDRVYKIFTHPGISDDMIFLDDEGTNRSYYWNESLFATIDEYRANKIDELLL